jgi:hypothetical protein
MNVARPVSCFSACLFLALAINFSNAQQPVPNPVAAACGSTPANYTVKRGAGSPVLDPPPPREALVYIIETMPDVPWVTKKVNIGLDGSWIGATDAMTHISFPVTQGTHHLCAVYQGHAASMDDEGQILLLRLKAEAGHIYYIRYHAMFLKDSPGIAFFEKVDDDEGLLLLQDSDQATSTLKK